MKKNKKYIKNWYVSQEISSNLFGAVSKPGGDAFCQDAAISADVKGP